MVVLTGNGCNEYKEDENGVLQPIILGCLSNAASLGTFRAKSNAHVLGIDPPRTGSNRSFASNHPGRETVGIIVVAHSSPDHAQSSRHTQGFDGSLAVSSPPPRLCHDKAPICDNINVAPVHVCRRAEADQSMHINSKAADNAATATAQGAHGKTPPVRKADVCQGYINSAF